MLGFLFKTKQLPPPNSEFAQDFRLNYKHLWDVQNCAPAYLKRTEQLIFIRDGETLAFVESAGELMMELAFRIFASLARALASQHPEGFEKFVLQLNSFAAMRALLRTASSPLMEPDQADCLQILVATTIAVRLWPDHAAQALGESNRTVTALLKLGWQQSGPFLLRKTAADLKKPLVASVDYQADIAAASQACWDLMSASKIRPIPNPAAALAKLIDR